MINKKDVIDKLIVTLGEKLSAQEEVLHGAEAGRRSAPTAMESHSDKTRHEMETKIQNTERRIEEIKEAVKYFEQIKNEEKSGGEAKAGSLLEVENVESKAIAYYLIAEKMGGIMLDNPVVSTVSLEAPVAKFLLGKREGEIVDFGDEEKFKIRRVL